MNAPTLPTKAQRESNLREMAREYLADWDAHASGANSASVFGQFCTWLAEKIGELDRLEATCLTVGAKE